MILVIPVYSQTSICSPELFGIFGCFVFLNCSHLRMASLGTNPESSDRVQQVITDEGGLTAPKSGLPTTTRKKAKVPAWAQPIVAELAALRLHVQRSTTDAATTPGHPYLNVAVADYTAGDSSDDESDTPQADDDAGAILSRESLRRQATSGTGRDRNEELVGWVAKLRPLTQQGSRLADRERYEIRSNLLLYRLWHALDIETRIYVRERLRLLVVAHLFGWGSTLRAAQRDEARSLGFNPDEYVPLGPAGRGWPRPPGAPPASRSYYPPAPGTGPQAPGKKRRRGKRGSGPGRGLTIEWLQNAHHDILELDPVQTVDVGPWLEDLLDQVPSEEPALDAAEALDDLQLVDVEPTLEEQWGWTNCSATWDVIGHPDDECSLAESEARRRRQQRGSGGSTGADQAAHYYYY